MWNLSIMSHYILYEWNTQKNCVMQIICLHHRETMNSFKTLGACVAVETKKTFFVGIPFKGGINQKFLGVIRKRSCRNCPVECG